MFEFEIMGCPTLRNPSVQKIPNFSKADFNEIRKQLINRNWAADFLFMNTNQRWEHFSNTIRFLIQQYVPFEDRRSIKKGPVWADKCAIKAIRTKRQSWIKFRKKGCNYEEYTAKAIAAKRSVRRAKKKFEKSLIKNMKTNPRKFYAYLNSKKKNQNRIGPINSDNGHPIEDDIEMAESFNRVFSSVFQRGPDTVDPAPKLFDETIHDAISFVEFPRELVEKKLKHLRAHSAPGPDDMHPLFLKSCAHELSEPLALIFESSMIEGCVPDEWKRTNITPIHKSGSKALAENYRPINVCSIPCKLMEGIIKDAIIEHLVQNELILPSQHGFLPGRSCVTNLLAYLDEVTKALDEGVPFDVIMVDFRRAFDVVPFRHLLNKLEAHGIAGQLLGWFRDWMNNRKQRVVINGHSSSWQDVISSVVQGSVIGPVLFIIFINDIDFVIDKHGTTMFKYADDSKFGRRIRSTNDAAILQSDLNGVVQWAARNGMTLHPQKTVVVHFGRSNPRHQYTISGTVISTADVVKDLGVLISHRCSPSDHVMAATKKANGVLAQIRRTTICRSVDMVTRTYKTYVRPIIEASVQAWNPWLRRDVDHLEKIQHRATKLVHGIGSKPYDERLAICNLTSLEHRRERGDMILAFKLMNGLSDLETTCMFSFANERHSKDTRSSAERLLVPERTSLDTRKYFFANRIVNRWNQLPNEIRTASSVNSFKNMYDTFSDIV